MYERFTDRVRKTVRLASNLARSLGYESFLPEHLLAGILDEGNGVGVAALTELEINPGDLRSRLSSLLNPSGKSSATDAENKISLAPETENIYEQAIQIAREMCHNYVGTEHFTIALMSPGSNITHDLFKKLDISREIYKASVVKILGSGVDENDEHFWMIPKSGMNFLQAFGYFASGFQSEPSSTKGSFDVFDMDMVANGRGTPVANYSISRKGDLDKLVILYNGDDEQIEKALTLRNLLDQNSVPYRENPSRREVAWRLKRVSDKKRTLANKLVGHDSLVE